MLFDVDIVLEPEKKYSDVSLRDYEEVSDGSSLFRAKYVARFP
jgi:hypothetical protein